MSQIATPQCVPQGPQRGPQRELRRRLKSDIRLVTFLETIVRDAGVDVVDVVKTDISGEPVRLE